MTICFKTYPDMKKFCGRLFLGSTKDSVLPIFSTVNLSFNFKQAQVDCDEQSVEEMEAWLESCNIKYNYVSQF